MYVGFLDAPIGAFLLTKRKKTMPSHLGPFKDRRFKPSKNGGGRCTCEASTGVDYSGSAPLIRMCNKSAAWIHFGTKQPTCRLGILLCQEHYDHFKAVEEVGAGSADR